MTSRTEQGRRSRWPLLVVILLCAAYGAWEIFYAETKLWELGRQIPIEPPQEERRVFNRHRFSMIAPPNWEARLIGEEDEAFSLIHFTPRTRIVARSAAMMDVRLIPDELAPSDRSNPVQFAGNIAYLQRDIRLGSLDESGASTWIYYVPHEGKWFEISYLLRGEWREIPPMALRYLETARFDEADDPNAD